jgi:hypothetical protein
MCPLLISSALSSLTFLSNVPPDFNVARVLTQLFLASCLGAGLLAVIYWSKIKQLVVRFSEHEQSPKQKS